MDKSRLLPVAAAAALVGAGALAGWSHAASSPAARTAGAMTPVPYSDLQLASPAATELYDLPTSSSGPCTATSKPFETTVSLSADGSGDGVLTIGTEDLGNWPHSVYETSSSQLELVYSGSGTDSAGGSYTVTSIFTGYGTSFSGTETLTAGQCSLTRPQSLTLDGSGLTLVGQPTTSTTTTTTTTTTTGTGTSEPAGSTAPPAPTSYPCSTRLLTSCSVTGIALAAAPLSGTPFNPVDGYIPYGTAEYEQLLALGFIPVSGECDEACVIEVEALLSSGRLKIGSSAAAAAVHLKELGKAQLKIHHGTASARLRFTKAGKKLLREVTAQSFEIELKLWATTPSGKSLGKPKIAYLQVARR